MLWIKEVEMVDSLDDLKSSRSCHRQTVLVKAPTLLGALLAISVAGHHGPSSSAGCITQSQWEELIEQESLPRYPSWSVFSSSSVWQPSSLVSSSSGASSSRSLTHASLGHNLAMCPIPPYTQHVRPFPLLRPFLHSCLCPCLSTWVFVNAPSGFLRLRPRLAVARHNLSLPLTSRSSFFCPLTLSLPFPLLLPFEAGFSVSTICAQRLCELLDDLLREVRRHLF